MKILWHSAAPWVNSGYGRCTREIVSRLQNTEHEVGIKCLSSVSNGEVEWHGEDAPVDFEGSITVHGSEKPFGLGSVQEDFKKGDYDLYHTHFDTWMEVARKHIPEFGIPYSSYVIVDHYPVPDAVVDQVQNAEETFAMSKWAKEVLTEKGTYSKYVPHGVNTDEYHPIEEDSGELPKAIEVVDEGGNHKQVSLEDNFIVGIVAANHADRKRIPEQMEAFERFRKEEDEDAILYVHTEVNSNKGYNLEQVRKEIGIPQENLIWCPPERYRNIGDEELNKWYNCFDVMMNCSMGESWGLTITEAMSAGTPVIVNNFSSMPEQLGKEPRVSENVDWMGEVGIADHGLLVSPTMGLYREKVSTKQYVCTPEDMAEALSVYHNDRDLMEEHGEKAREYVCNNYDWDEHVIPMWVEAFDELETRLNTLS